MIVPAYGVAHLLADALASLQAQTRGDWEAIVVDDGAPDDVAGAFARFADDDRVGLLQTDNGGLATARNRAAAIARAPYLALLDGDDAWEPDYVATMLAAIEADPEVGFVTCDASYFGLADRAGERFSRFSRQDPPLTLERVLRRQFNIFVGCIIRREAFDAMGGFDGALRSVEDFDLWARLLAAGWRGGYVAAPLVRYRRRPGSLSSNERTMLACEQAVYAKLAAMLDGRSEAATARAMLADVEARAAWAEGEALILSGEARAGLRKLSGIEQRSLRWKLAMPVMRMMPALAAPLLRVRPRLPAPPR